MRKCLCVWNGNKSNGAKGNGGRIAQELYVGTKKNSKGYKESWIVYKLHIDDSDGSTFPLAVF